MKFETTYKLKDENIIKLVLWDTSRQERFRFLTLNSLRSIRGIILVFDVKVRTFEIYLND